MKIRCGHIPFWGMAFSPGLLIGLAAQEVSSWSQRRTRRIKIHVKASAS